MANFCLLPEKVAEFRKALKEKEITIPSLLNMTSEERTALLSKYAGDSAPQVNTLFEEKLVLKNRMIGIKNWASKVGEIGKYSPEGKAKLDKAISEYRAKQQERILNPKENEAFLNDLANKQLGTEVTQEEAKQVFELSKKVDDLKKNFDGEKWTNETDRLNYGVSKVLYENYVSELKGEGEPFKEVVKGRVQEFKNTAEGNVGKAVVDLGKDALKALNDNAVGLVASVDNSFLGRQGLKTLFTHPSAWWDGAKGSFIDAYKTMGGKNTMDALMADVYSSPNYLNGAYKDAGIIAQNEEQFPTSLPEQIPGIGRVFKASEVAFKGSALRMRKDLYDLVSEMQTTNGVDMADVTNRKGLGTVINSLTARGKWGKYGESPIVKLVLWAPRMLKGNLDILTAHAGQDIPKFAKVEARWNLFKIAVSIATILGIAKAINKNSVEPDPTSSNWGKIMVNDTKISRIIGVLSDFVGISSNSQNGKTTYDVTGGLNSVVTAIARQLPKSLGGGATKSTVTGIKNDFGSGFGQTSRFDAIIDFFTGKTTPLAKTVVDFAKGQNFKGQKPTLLNEMPGLFIPISIQNILGIGGSQGGTDWTQNPGAELQAFQKQVGDEKFKKANDEYNKEVQRKTKILIENIRFKELSEDDKKKAITQLKSDVKDTIFKNYGFKYTKQKTEKFKLPNL